MFLVLVAIYFGGSAFRFKGGIGCTRIIARLSAWDDNTT